MKATASLALCALLLLSASSLAAETPKPDELHAAAQRVVTGCRGTGFNVSILRDAGPAGLAALLAVCDELATQPPDDPAVAEAQYRRMSQNIDQVGAQRDCWTSRLYWYTDLDAALAEARATGKPILSLRLLGNLTDECSCANSRFFRTALYANAEVSQALRERFVLHWKSVRPVPRVTIDFGDGRKIERTITGNSIHYVLDSQGRLVDALPGLYGPRAFLRGLQRAETAAQAVAGLADGDRAAALAAFHRDRIDEIASEWSTDLDQLGIVRPDAPASQTTLAAGPPTAIAVGLKARGKGAVELPILAALATGDATTLEQATNDEVWEQIAALHAEDAVLDQGSVALMRRKNPAAVQAGVRALTKRAVEDPLVRLVASFQRSIALDTVHNEYQFHRQIHEWLAAGDPVPAADVDTFNERVYADLFLTPSSDPWLGLVPENTYTALENGGLVEGQ